MNNQEELNEFLSRLFDNALKKYQKTKEYELSREKRDQIDALVTARYPEETKAFFEQCTFQIELELDRKTEFIYRQGLKDCIEILKTLGVLA